MHRILRIFYEPGDAERFIAIQGIAGIGKSAIAKQLCHYIQARTNDLSETIFTDGVIYLKLSS
jgi:hypothetical protein